MRCVVLRSPGGRIAVRFPRRTAVMVLALGIVLLASAFVSLCLGSRAISPETVLKALLMPGDGASAFIINELRLPRVVLAMLVGAAFAVAGLLLQGLVRNPLASPDVIGVTGGGCVAAVTFMSFHATTVPVHWLPLVAMVGAAASALLIVVLAWRRGVTPARLVLIGVGIAAAMGAVTTLIMVLNPDITTLQAYVWLIGSLYAAQWREVQGVLPWVAVCVPVALAHARHMEALALGDGLAAGLGVNVMRTRLLMLAASVALAGSAVAFAGGIGFVGLMAPHIARWLTRGGFAGLVLVSALVGGVIVVYADLVARVVFLPRDLPAGIFVAGIGAPFFVYLLYRNRH